MSVAATPLRPLDLGAGRGLRIVRGEGCRLVDSDGRTYVDLMSNYGVAVLGHAHPDVVEAVTAQARTLLSTHQSFASPSRDACVAALAGLLPAALSRVVFANSGAEAVEVAMKLARAATGRTRLVAMHRAYHGRTLGALSLTASAAYRDPFLPLLADVVVHVAYDDLDALDAVLDSRVAAVVVEPIQGEAGVRLPQAGYLAAVRARCTAAGALLVVDEVQTGLRTGAFTVSSAEGVVPDILCLGKGIANGLPMAVTVATEAVAEGMPRGGHGSTSAGGPLVCAGAAATLGVLADPALHTAVRARGLMARERLLGLPSSAVREVRGRGLMIALELRQPATPLVIELQRRGVLVLTAGRTVIRLLPPLIIDEVTLASALDTIAEVVTAGS